MKTLMSFTRDVKYIEQRKTDAKNVRNRECLHVWSRNLCNKNVTYNIAFVYNTIHMRMQMKSYAKSGFRFCRVLAAHDTV